LKSHGSINHLVWNNVGHNAFYLISDMPPFKMEMNVDVEISEVTLVKFLMINVKKVVPLIVQKTITYIKINLKKD
jgi:hypothetical protein